MMGRVRVFACLLTVGIVAAALLSALSVAAPPPIPMRTQGQAFDRAGTPLPIATPIRAFIDGVDYSNDPQIQNGAGTYSILISGNSKDNANVSDTPMVQEGANLGDSVIYAAGDFTAVTDVFRETVPWSPGTVRMTDLHVGSNATTPQPLNALLTDRIGQTSVIWNTPEVTVTNVLLRVDVQDPFGAQASDTRTVSLSRQSPLALIIAVLIAIVLGLFLLFGFLRARKKPAPPAGPPPTPPLAPEILPPVGAATVTQGLAPDKKVCPRCHTHVNASDVTCFFCGYKFPEEAKPPP